ncbi:MAG: ATP-binding protein [Cyanobacteria bacterium P01_F01_bin.153]
MITTGEQDISPVRVRKDQGLSVITVGLPMRDNEGKLSGALLTQINLEQLQYIINQSQTGDSGYLYIVDQNNLVITQTLRAETSYQDFSLQHLKDPILIQQVRDQNLDRRYLNQYQGLQGLSVLGASSRIYAVDWFVVVELPSQELDKVVWNSLMIACLVLLGAGGVSITVGFILSRSILIPLQRLNAAALSISAGYLDTKVPEGFRNEFGTLANAFNTMVNQVRQSFQSLEQRNGDLKSTLEELKSTQTQLIQTEKMSSLGQLVAGVAHELNNPIGFIHGNVEHARSHSEALLEAIALYQEHCSQESSELKEQLEELDIDYICDDFPKLLSSIEDGTNRVQSIVKSLRNFSRLDESESKHVDIHEGIENTLIILRSKLKSNNKSCVVEVVKDYGDVPPIECYPAQLNQVILNLIDNAIHALSQLRYREPSQSELVNSEDNNETDSRPVIVISTGVDEFLPTKSGAAEKKPCCWIRVRDNGAGIPEAVRDRIFDPFFTTKPVGQGTGLGLSISYKIITETHGGSLTCKSVVGEGTEFTIRIPTTQKVAAETPAEQALHAEVSTVKALR